MTEPLNQDEPQQGVLLIPWQQLSEQALLAIADEFINRDGTDYGEHEVSLEDKVAQVIGQIKSGKVLVLFDPIEETCQLAYKDQVPAQLLD